MITTSLAVSVKITPAAVNISSILSSCRAKSVF
jgi:hypothetical protein